MRRRTHLISSLIALLILSATVPCALLEGGDASARTAQELPTDRPCGEEPAAEAVDCCAGCLTCCASFLEPIEPAGTASTVVGVRVSALLQAPFSAPLSIWRPPRA